jgi:AraC-like DNA-binding protein
MIADVVDHIIAYADFLKNKYGFLVSIHICHNNIYDYLAPYTYTRYHTAPFCSYLKRNMNIRTKCIGKKDKVTEKCKEGAYYGMCYCGVEEFFVPVIFEGAVIGFVSIGSFKSDSAAAMERIDRVIETYHLDRQTVMDLYNSGFKENTYDMDFIRLLSTAIAKEIEFICLEHVKEKGAIENVSSSENHIYMQILTYLQTHYRYNLRLEEVCEIFGCSKSYISHMFKKKSGCTFNGYINRVRIEQAKKLLVQTELSMNEIAEEVGFSAYFYFANTFKRFCGVSPREYKKQTLLGGVDDVF